MQMGALIVSGGRHPDSQRGPSSGACRNQAARLQHSMCAAAQQTAPDHRGCQPGDSPQPLIAMFACNQEITSGDHACAELILTLLPFIRLGNFLLCRLQPDYHFCAGHQLKAGQ